MVEFRSRAQILAAKIQTTIGTEVTPSVSTDAVVARLPIAVRAPFETLDTDYVTGTMSFGPPIIGGGYAEIDVPMNLRGKGNADLDTLLRACGFSATTLASAATGTASAGASLSITLAAGSSSVDGAYVGMPLRITAGTGAGGTWLVSNYVGSTKVATLIGAAVTPDNTSVYSIDANVLYKPVSIGNELVTMHHYQRSSLTSGTSHRFKLFDGAGNFKLAIKPRQLPQIDFTVRGKLSAIPDDTADPGNATFPTGLPVPVMAAQTYLGGAAMRFNDFSFDLGADMQMFADPGSAFGYDGGAIVSRKPSGSIEPDLTRNSTRNAFSQWLANTDQTLWMAWGATALSRVSLYMPAVRYTGNERGDAAGFVTEKLPFRAYGPDNEILICLS